MNAKKVVVTIIMVGIVAAGADVLMSAVSHSQSSYHPPPDSASTAHHDAWRAATADEKAGAEKAIVGQLDAFKQDDYVKATSYQSMGLRGNFHTVSSFKRTIQQGYPEFAHYKSIVFVDARSNYGNSTIGVQVKLTGQDGVTVNAVYYMHRESGGYKVAGVGGGMAPRLPRKMQKAT